MADIRSTPMRTLRGSLLPPLQERDEKLRWWVTFSGTLHVLVISAMFLMPSVSPRKVSYPVYTVELVGGEKLGGANFGTAIEPARPAKQAAKAKTEPAPEVKVARKEKAKPAEKTPQMSEEAALKKSKKETKKEAREEPGLPGELREKLIQSALERVRERAESGKKKEPGAALSAGPAEGEGAAAIGSGGRGGGIVKGVEFIVYYNQMRRLIRERWTWVGKRSDLEVTVRFGIQENGEIVGLKIVQGSPDPSYDDSVMRAVRRAAPLPPPPESYRKDFMDVELTFRPKDLGG